MNWDDLRFFLALARKQSVSAAGRELNVKHTTVARRIASLEEQLGSRLFDRTPSGYALTQVGENLLPHAMDIEERVSAADREVLGMDAQLAGSLRLASSYDLLTRLITPKIKRFTDKYPCIEVELVSSAGLVDLGSREADIALRISPKPPEHLIGREIVPIDHGVYATETYLQQNNQPHQLVLWLNDKVMPEWVIRHFANGKVVVRSNEIMTMVEAVKNHLGLARMPCYIGDAEPSLRRLDLPLTPSKWGVWVLSHKDLRSTARVRACREFLIETVSQQRVLIEGTNSNYYDFL
jgi:DNA-binding transcriptional LysR family regulator